MGKIKVIKKSTLSGKTEADDYKIYPVTKTEAVFTDKEDVDAADASTPQGANKTVKEILNSIRSKGWVNTDRLKDQSVTSAKIATNAVTKEKLAEKSVGTTNLEDKSVTTVKLADNSVDGNKLGDGVVDTQHLKAKAVMGSKLADQAVSSDKIADKAVTTQKLANKSVTTEKLADQSVTGEKIKDGEIGNKKLASQAISGDKLQDSSITKDKLGGDVKKMLNETEAKLNNVVFHETEIDDEVPVPSGEQIGTDILLDTQDFQVEDKKIQLANRDNTLGMGYKILRPHHIVENRAKMVLTAQSKAYYSGMLHITVNGVQYHVELTENDDAATVMSKIYAVIEPELTSDYILTLSDNTITIIKRDNTEIADCIIDNADTNADVHVENTTENIDIYSIGQSDFDSENTIYEVRYNFNLDHNTITIPSGSVIKFNGGNLNNGSIVFDSTYILGPTALLFDSTLNVSGSYYSHEYTLTTV